MTDSSAAIEAKITRVCDLFSMLPEKGGSVVVGVSGGADSMALLFYLWKTAREGGFSLCAAHLNHGLRGEEAERDERFVRDFCAEQGIECAVRRADVRKEAEKRGESEETCGRNLRYDFFSELAAARGARIATAHTLSDNVETVLLNLTRGTGLSGLCGIPPIRGEIVRPLLFLTRSETETYCRENGIPFVTDSTNFSPVYARNRVRLEVIPVLKSINPSLEKAVLRMTRTLSGEEKFLSAEAERALSSAKRPEGYDLALLSRLPEPLLLRALRLISAELCGSRAEKIHIDLLCRAVREGKGDVMLPGKRILSVSDGLLREPAERSEFPDWSIPFEEALRSERAVPGFFIEKIDRKTYEDRLKINNLLFKNAVAYDTIAVGTVLRGRRAGDRFSPAGRGIRKSLKKLFQEEKIPFSKRESVALLGNGTEILWIEGIGSSETARVKADTQTVVLIFSEEKNNA